MNPSQTKSALHRQKRSERRRCRRLEKVASTVSLPDDLMKEVLSFLPVKSLTRLRCLAKSFNSFISDQHFIKMHLNRSLLRLTFIRSYKFWPEGSRSRTVYSFNIVHMLNNGPTISDLPIDNYHPLLYGGYLIDSCNGLLCYFYHSNSDNESWFRFWNPATRTISDKLGLCNDNLGDCFNFTFGYDHSKHTLKLVRFFHDTTEVRVFSLNDNVWRNIQNSPVAHCHRVKESKYVHISDSVTWFVLSNYKNHSYYEYDYKNISIEQFMIISLDLRTETYTKLLPPQGFNEVPFLMPNLKVLNGCLCFSHDFKQTHFIIWQMREFGVENSWTQFLKISYHTLQISSPYLSCTLFPLCLSEKNNTLLLTSYWPYGDILYNWRDNRARFVDLPSWFISAKDYVESLYC